MLQMYFCTAEHFVYKMLKSDLQKRKKQVLTFSKFLRSKNKVFWKKTFEKCKRCKNIFLQSTKYIFALNPFFVHSIFARKMLGS